MDRTLILAHGKALAVLATILDRAGVVKAGEFGELMALFSVLVAEEDPDQGDILAVWAGILKETGELHDTPGPA